MKIICIGRNYAAHARELNNPVPKRPVIFMKPPSALLVNNKPMYYPDFTKDLHYECEVVLKIKKNGRHVQPEHASGYYEEITLGIDFTARDLQSELKEKGHPWELAKGFDGSAAVGKFIPKSEIEGDSIRFDLMKNKEIVQSGNTTDLLFPFDDLIVFVSKFFKLQMGDLIFTGTPAGVGPVKIGDQLEGIIQTNSGAQKVLRCQIR
ncbi:MAG: FAA hydrolase family protein [Bacteroidetes bacterium]|nr:MAG: FAA hydrolase family protein [Bacteroidota bacterium]